MIQHASSTDPVTVVMHHFEDDNYNEMAIVEESWSDSVESQVEFRLVDPTKDDLTSLQMLCEELEVPFGTMETEGMIVKKLRQLLYGNIYDGGE